MVAKLNKKKCIYFLLALIAFASAIIVANQFHLLLTVPLILCGVALLFLSQSYDFQKHKWINFVLIQLGLVACLMGFFMALINAFYSLFSTDLVAVTAFTSVKNAKNVQSRIEYRNNAQVIDSGVSNPLGYSWKPNLELNDISMDQNSRSFDEKYRERNIYNATYHIDKSGNRLNPFQPVNSPYIAIFMGCSFTFGWGLNDEQTLPALFSKLSGWKAINTGMGGYGSHQVLKLLEDDQLYKKRTEGGKNDLIIYRMIFDHAIRAAGYSWGDRYGPCYQVSQAGNIEYKGSFSKCYNTDWYLPFIQARYDELMTTTEPLTRQILRRTRSSLVDRIHRLYVRKFASLSSAEKDFTRHAKIIEKINDLAKQRGIKFLVIAEDFRTDKKLCDVDPIVTSLIKIFDEKKITYVKTSDIFNKQDCALGKYEIAGDGHPSEENNLAIAKYLTAWLSQNGLN